MFIIINDILLSFLRRLVNYLPNFFGGLIILLIGLVLASILKKVLLSLLAFFRLASLLQSFKLMNQKEVKVWEEVLAEILRLTIVILFLIPTLEVWGLSRATPVLNQFLLYLPNVIIAVIIGFIGLLFANLVYDLVQGSIKVMGASSAKTLAIVAKTSIIFFTVLIVMNQLGVAQDLIRILFTGIVAMFALAGGLAFGLGGQEAARGVINSLKKRMK